MLFHLFVTKIVQIKKMFTAGSLLWSSVVCTTSLHTWIILCRSSTLLIGCAHVLFATVHSSYRNTIASITFWGFFLFLAFIVCLACFVECFNCVLSTSSAIRNTVTCAPSIKQQGSVCKDPSANFIILRSKTSARLRKDLQCKAIAGAVTLVPALVTSASP